MSDEPELKMLVELGWKMIYAGKTLWSRFITRTGTKGSMPGGPTAAAACAACGDPLVPVRVTNRDQRSTTNRDQCSLSPGQIEPGPMDPLVAVCNLSGTKGKNGRAIFY